MTIDTWIGFRYRGKDKRGVSKWVGRSWDGVLKWFGLSFTIYGAGACISFIGLLLYALFTLSWPITFAYLVSMSGIHSLFFGGTGLWMLKMRQHIQFLQSADKVSARFGLDEATLAQMAQEKGITPRMNLNGMDYYRPEDFAENALMLLRGTTRPAESQDVLLRAASTNTPTAPNEMLRVPETDASSQNNFVYVAAEAPSETEVQQMVVNVES